MKKYILFTIIFILSFSFSKAQTTAEKEETCRVEKVYPNPVNNFVFIEIHQENYTYAKIELIDILGNQVQKWQPKALFPGDQKLRIDFQNLRSGIYLLRIRIDEQEFVKRIRKE
ncbi:T9SS type A sorting domain-containing protein [Sunxiuqinia sp. A32]|uniref:T9SS type A sorting domain-containing protein n=1 Tax=Sunxiuqinia sp. A32 TaxID=3461496 RepID=UPI004045ED9C